MDWCLYGDDKRKEMDRDLKPEYLLDDLRRYQDVFGEEFGVKELLMLEDIRVKAMIAGALADMPEFLIDQIGKANNSSTFPSVTRLPAPRMVFLSMTEPFKSILPMPMMEFPRILVP